MYNIAKEVLSLPLFLPLLPPVSLHSPTHTHTYIVFNMAVCDTYIVYNMAVCDTYIAFNMAVCGEVEHSHHHHRQVHPQVIAKNSDENPSRPLLLLYLQGTPSRPTMGCVAQTIWYRDRHYYKM